MKTYLFKPFLRIAGLQSLLLGFFVMALTAIISVWSHCHFDGAVDVHIGAQTSLWFYFIEPLIDWLCLFVFLFIAGKFAAASRIRLIDVAGTVALARWPMIIVALLAFITLNEPVNINDIKTSQIVFGMATLVFAIWMIALLYNAYTVSCNAKGSKAIVSFIIAIVLAESVSKLIVLKMYGIL